LPASRNDAHTELSVACAGRDTAHAERDTTALSKRDLATALAVEAADIATALAAEQDAATPERDAKWVACEAAVVEHNTVRAERDAPLSEHKTVRANAKSSCGSCGIALNQLPHRIIENPQPTSRDSEPR